MCMIDFCVFCVFSGFKNTEKMILETERLLLRPITIEDKNDIFQYRSDKETNKYQGWIPETLDDVETFIGKISSKIDIPDTWFQFVIVDKEINKIVGDLGIHFLGGDNKQAEIGCTLNKNHQNKGYASEAICKVMDYLFQDLDKHRIVTSIDPDNTDSIRLVERLGFRKEAHFVQSLLINGEWMDDIVYALTSKDWKSQKEKSTSYKFPEIETERFLLRQFTIKDLENVFIGLSHPDVIKYYGISFDTLEATKEQIRWFRDLEKNETGFWWAICSKDNKTFYGAGGFNDLEKDNRKAEVGFWLLPEHWGKGVMSEVMPIICNYGFKELNLHRIEGYVDSKNTNCKNALIKLNFKHEGTMVDCEIKDGEFVSLDIWSLIND